MKYILKIPAIDDDNATTEPITIHLPAEQDAQPRETATKPSESAQLASRTECPDARNHHLYTTCGTCGWKSPDRDATFRAQLEEIGL